MTIVSNIYYFIDFLKSLVVLLIIVSIIGGIGYGVYYANKLKNMLMPGQKQEGESCVLPTDCNGFIPLTPEKLSCCNGVCTKMVKDYTNTGWCPSDCRRTATDYPGSCSVSQNSIQVGGVCKSNNDCVLVDSGNNKVGCCNGTCKTLQRDWANSLECPENCVGTALGNKGTCHPPKDKGSIDVGGTCSIDDDCVQTNSYGCDVRCCSGVCKIMNKDYNKLPFCPETCKNSPIAPPGSCVQDYKCDPRHKGTKIVSYSKEISRGNLVTVNLKNIDNTDLDICDYRWYIPTTGAIDVCVKCLNLGYSHNSASVSGLVSYKDVVEKPDGSTFVTGIYPDGSVVFNVTLKTFPGESYPYKPCLVGSPDLKEQLGSCTHCNKYFYNNKYSYFYRNPSLFTGNPTTHEGTTMTLNCKNNCNRPGFPNTITVCNKIGCKLCNFMKYVHYDDASTSYPASTPCKYNKCRQLQTGLIVGPVCSFCNDYYFDPSQCEYNTPTNVVCIFEGTNILSFKENQYVEELIENLKVGDVLVTNNSRFGKVNKKIKFIYKNNNTNTSVLIKKDILDVNSPNKDLFLTEKHLIFLPEKYSNARKEYENYSKNTMPFDSYCKAKDFVDKEIVESPERRNHYNIVFENDDEFIIEAFYANNSLVGSMSIFDYKKIF